MWWNFVFVSLESRQKGNPEEIIAFPVIPSICLFQWFVMQAEVETFFPKRFGPYPCKLVVVEALLSSPDSVVVVEERLCLTGTDVGVLWMFQNTEFYRSRGPRFPASLEQRKSLLSKLVSEASEGHSGGEQ